MCVALVISSKILNIGYLIFLVVSAFPINQVFILPTLTRVDAQFFDSNI